MRALVQDESLRLAHCRGREPHLTSWGNASYSWDFPQTCHRRLRSRTERQFFDLRTTIRSILAEAQSRVLLAAPFWDLEVAADLAEILRRRQQAGVRVAILSRQPQLGSTNEYALAAIRAALPPSSGCEIRILSVRLLATHSAHRPSISKLHVPMPRTCI